MPPAISPAACFISPRHLLDSLARLAQRNDLNLEGLSQAQITIDERSKPLLQQREMESPASPPSSAALQPRHCSE